MQALESIIRRIKTGDEEAFEELYERTYAYVQYKIASYGIRQGDRDDVVQEVFLQVYQSLEQLKDENCYMRWLAMITHSKCNGFVRKKSRYCNMQIYDLLEIEEENEEYLPEKWMEKSERKSEVNNLLKHLDAKSKEVLELRYLKECSMDEIALICKIPQGTVKSRLHCARGKIQKLSLSLYL